MQKKFINFLVILAIMIGALFVLTGCSNDIDVSQLCFNPKGVWVDIGDGEPMFELYSDGTLEYGADELGSWEVIGKDLINVSLGDDGNYDINVFQLEGHNLIGNQNATFCFEDDYKKAHEDIYLPSMPDAAEFEEPSDTEFEEDLPE